MVWCLYGTHVWVRNEEGERVGGGVKGREQGRMCEKIDGWMGKGL